MSIRRHLTINQFEMIVAIAEHKSLAAAARRLHLTPSALSHRLRLLESAVQESLVVRGAGPARLTPAGERVLDAGRQILGAVDALDAELMPTRTSGTTRLRVATECYTCYQWLPACVRELQAVAPEVKVILKLAATRRPLAALRSGAIDLALVTSRLSGAGLEMRNLMRDELVVVVAPFHPWARRTHVEAEDFRDVELFTLFFPFRETTLYRHVLHPAGVTPKRISALPLVEAIVEMVRQGIGVAVLPRWVVAQAQREQLIATVRVTRAGIHRQWRAYFRRRAAHADAARALCRAVVDWAQPESVVAIRAPVAGQAPAARATG